MIADPPSPLEEPLEPHPAWPDRELERAFWRYETALMADDVSALDDLFAESTTTLRSTGGATLVGHSHIAQMRATRGGAPRRRLTRVHLRDLGTGCTLVVAESVRPTGSTGVQTQVWELLDGRWQITAAHVSSDGPSEEWRAATIRLLSGSDSTIWRVPPGSTPLVSGRPGGPLTGASVAVKDLFAVAGQQIGGGTPAWLAQAGTEPRNAAAVDLLTRAGADVIGIAHTDELAFSLAGTNIHYGTPPNPAAPGRIPGGSTSGPAAAVATGAATIGLGTDTAGSIRVPAAYCGLYGLRTTHDDVPRRGLLGLAPSFDTVGVLTRDLATLRAASAALLPTSAPTAVTRLILAPSLLALAEEETQTATLAALRAIPAHVSQVHVDPDQLETWFTAFRTVQQAEAWAMHGGFISHHGESLEPAVRERFQTGAQVSAQAVTSARDVLDQARDQLRDLLDDAALVLPTSSAPAPARDASEEEIATARAGTLRLTCLASLAGFPQVSAPTARVGTAPGGLSLIGPPGSDLSLLDILEATRRTR